MELPPKNDNDDASSGGQDSGKRATKKTRRPRAAAAAPAAPRSRAKKAPAPAPDKGGAAPVEVRAPAVERPAKVVEPKSVQAEAPRREREQQPEMIFHPTPPPASAPAPAPAPREIPSSPEPSRAAPENADRESSHREATNREPTNRETNEGGRDDDSSRPDTRGADSGQSREQGPREGQGQSGGSQGGGGGNPGNQGHQQQPQGGGDWQQGERGFWKRNRRDKRKRGKFGDRGPWQPGGNSGGNGGGGGGGGGGGSSSGHTPHPPQPRPPENAPVFGDLPNPARFDDLEALNKLAAEISSGAGEPIFLDQLYALTLADLTAFARRLGVTFEGAPARRPLIAQIFAYATTNKIQIRDRGWIDFTDRGGNGFIVHEHVNYRLYPEDAYLAESFVKRYGLKRGHQVEVLVQAPQGPERCPSVLRVDQVMGLPPTEIEKIIPFEELIPYYPLKRILLEATEIHKDVSMRAVDLLTPVGFGQRGLIVAPPRTGKTVLLQSIANSISNNFPETKLILLLIDERPEEVTDFRRHTKGEVVSSTFDEAPESHVHCAEMVGEKARRLVEMGQHVVILLDSITRLARAYNALASNAGKIMSGGLEATALQKPKRFFGAARNIEGGGSLTILATALIDTGSRMDEVIFEEFKGTGNMELHLDRGLVEKRIFPAINIDRSGTRKEELIYHPEEMQRVYGLRRAMQGIPSVEAMELFLTRLKKTKSNAEFLMSLNR